MKKIVFIFFALLLLISCDSDNSASKSNSLNGRWNWIKESGGIAGTTNTPESTGKTMVLEFNGQTQKTYVNGELKNETTYTIETGESIMGGKRQMIVLKDGIKKTFVVEGNRLYISDECYDCFQSTYERIIF